MTVPVIGMGGIMDGEDAVEFLLAGATAVAVGTANFVDPTATMRVLDGLAEYCRRHGVGRVIGDLVGALELNDGQFDQALHRDVQQAARTRAAVDSRAPGAFPFFVTLAVVSLGRAGIVLIGYVVDSRDRRCSRIGLAPAPSSASP